MKKIISFEKKLDFPSMIGEVTAISLDHDLKFIDASTVSGEFTISGNYKLTEASRLEEKFEYHVPSDIILNEKLDLSTAKIEIDDFYYEIENDDIMICYIDVKIEGVEEIMEEPEEEEPRDLLLEESHTEIQQQEHDEPVVFHEQTDSKKVKKVDDQVEEVELIQEITHIPSSKELEERCAELETSSVSKEELETEMRDCDGDNKMEGVTSVTMTTQEKEGMEEKAVSDIDEKLEQESKEDSNTENVGSLFSSFKDSDETFATYSVYILRQEETIQTLIEKYNTTKEELEDYNDLSNLTIGTKIIIPTKNE